MFVHFCRIKDCKNINKMLYSLMNSLRASNHPGYKFTE